MDDMESKLSSIMGDPEMMQKIMSFAQSLNQNAPPKQEAPKQEPSKQESPQNPFPDIDLSMLQKLSGFAGKSSIDRNQQNLLQALGPYLSRNRISRLERAMRAAKMAGMATTLLPHLTQGR